MKKIFFIGFVSLLGYGSGFAQAMITDVTRDRIKSMSYGFKRKVGSDSPSVKVYLCPAFYGDSVECLEYRVCVRCKYLYSDSIMNDNLDRLIALYKDSQKKKRALINDQGKWIRKRDKSATKTSKEFKGGTYEMIAFDKSLKAETDKRSKWLLKILEDFHN